MRKLTVLFILSCFFVAGCQSKEESVQVHRNAEQKHSNLFTAEAAVYEDHAQVKLLLHNQTNETLRLTFPSSQQFEVVIQSANGEELYRYSKDMLFSQALTSVHLQPGETKTWETVWSYDKKPFQKGETYTIVTKLLPLEVNGEKPDARSFEKTISYKSGNLADPVEATLDIEVQTEGTDGIYTVSGQAVAEVEQAYYAVSDGHVMLVEETKFDISQPWRISLHIPKEKLPANGTVILELYAKKKKEEAVVRKTVVLQQFHGTTSHLQ